MRIAWSLIFLLFVACTDQPGIEIQWEGRKAVAVAIPQKLLDSDSLNYLRVELKNSNTPILGNSDMQDGFVVFTPLIPFTRGLKYEINWKDQTLAEIEIPRDSTLVKPKIISVYPSGDSLPANLLKMYIVFSKPMQEGNALKNIVVIKNSSERLQNVFLDLEPELWNKEQTILTLWLDPGRIKRDLQPNQKLGAPLEPGNRYKIMITPGWTDAEGVSLESTYSTTFLAVGRDDSSPDPAAWTITAPKPNSRDTLRIHLNEQLDYQLLNHAVHIIDDNGNEVKGVITISDEESVFKFTPVRLWVAGSYNIAVEPRMEDLAGNNLVRLFDKDLLKDSVERKMKVHQRKFEVK